MEAGEPRAFTRLLRGARRMGKQRRRRRRRRRDYSRLFSHNLHLTTSLSPPEKKRECNNVGRE